MRPQKRKGRRELSRPFEECQKINAKIFRSKFSVNDERVVCVEEHHRMMRTPERCDNSTHLDLILNTTNDVKSADENCGGDPRKSVYATGLTSDVSRGTSPVADGASVLGDGSRGAVDDAHVAEGSGIQFKRKEPQNDPRYRTKLEPGAERERGTGRKRADKETKPV